MKAPQPFHMVVTLRGVSGLIITRPVTLRDTSEIRAKQRASVVAKPGQTVLGVIVK